ncbi:MAG: lytic transglycosylase domain-containing protein [Fibrobacterota bacterium]
MMKIESNSALANSTSLPVGKTGKFDDAKIREVARQFEAMYTAYMLKTMNQSIQRSDLVKENMGETVFRDMLMDEYANKMSAGKGLGLSDLIYKSLKNDPAQADAYSEKVRDYKSKKYINQVLKYTAGDFGAVKQTPLTDTVDERMRRIEPLVQYTAQRHGLDPNLLKAVVRQESEGNPYAVSKAGAKGLMQLMDETARSLGVRNSFDKHQNMDAGARYLKQLLEDFGGNQELALAAYNAGPDTVKKYDGVPPFPETQNYVANIKKYALAYASETQGVQP